MVKHHAPSSMEVSGPVRLIYAESEAVPSSPAPIQPLRDGVVSSFLPETPRRVQAQCKTGPHHKRQFLVCRTQASLQLGSPRRRDAGLGGREAGTRHLAVTYHSQDGFLAHKLGHWVDSTNRHKKIPGPPQVPVHVRRLFPS